MLALTLLRPWDAAILHLGKLVENRKWHPADHVCGQRIALHAGKGWDEPAVAFIRSCTEAAEPEVSRRIAESRAHAGVIVGTAVVAGWWRVGETEVEQPHGWAFGPWCWGLAGVRALAEPIPCKGALSLWRLPPDVEAKVLAQDRAETAA